MVSIKEATASAIVFAREALGVERTQGVRLEEVESTTIRGKEAWLITLSMIPPPGTLGVDAAMSALLGTGKREYKTFTVAKSDGEVKSMKIRELTDA